MALDLLFQTRDTKARYKRPQQGVNILRMFKGDFHGTMGILPRTLGRIDEQDKIEFGEQKTHGAEIKCPGPSSGRIVVCFHR